MSLDGRTKADDDPRILADAREPIAGARFRFARRSPTPLEVRNFGGFIELRERYGSDRLVVVLRLVSTPSNTSLKQTFKEMASSGADQSAVPSKGVRVDVSTCSRQAFQLAVQAAPGSAERVEPTCRGESDRFPSFVLAVLRTFGH